MVGRSHVRVCARVLCPRHSGPAPPDLVTLADLEPSQKYNFRNRPAWLGPPGLVCPGSPFALACAFVFPVPYSLSLVSTPLPASRGSRREQQCRTSAASSFHPACAA